MYRQRSLTSAAAIGMIATATFTTPAQAAPAARAHPAAPTAVHVVQRAVDVDGDGRRDTVKVTSPTAREGVTIWVRTARGRASTLQLATSGVAEQGVEPWSGSAAMDGVAGSELMIVEAFGDLPHYAVLTWRGNRLSRLMPPDKAATASMSWTISTGYEGVGYTGYSFGTSGGVRTVTAWRLDHRTTSGRWHGTGTTSRWTPKGWKQAGTTTTSVTASKAAALVAWGGLTITK